MKAKLVIGSIGVLGYLAYLNLSKYLKESKVETFNYLRSEAGETFFLGIDIFEAPNLKMPILKWKIDSIDLLVNNETVATSLPVQDPGNNFTQEFKPFLTANFENLKNDINNQNFSIEITYKTIVGLKITHKYNVNQIFATSSNEDPQEQTSFDTDYSAPKNRQQPQEEQTFFTAPEMKQNQQGQQCRCEPV